MSDTAQRFSEAYGKYQSSLYQLRSIAENERDRLDWLRRMEEKRKTALSEKYEALAELKGLLTEEAYKALCEHEE